MMRNLSHTDRAFLTLVKSGLWECDVNNTCISCLSPGQWEEIFRKARSQTVVGLVWQGIARLEDEAFMPAGHILPGMAAEIDKCERESRMMLSEVRKLFAELEDRGFHPVLQKGLSVAELYEKPEQRSCGDIDIYLPAEELVKAAPAEAVRSSDGAMTFERGGMEVELHSRLLDIADPQKKKFIDALVEKEGFLRQRDWTTTTPIVTLLLLDAHVLKHVFGWGVGLRQLCDYARARKVLRYDESVFCQCCRALGIERWTSVLDAFCEKYLYVDGLEVDEPLADELLEKVLEGGNFGKELRSELGAVQTAKTLVGKWDFSKKIAANEAFWHFATLLTGRLKSLFKG